MLVGLTRLTALMLLPAVERYNVLAGCYFAPLRPLVTAGASVAGRAQTLPDGDRCRHCRYGWPNTVSPRADYILVRWMRFRLATEASWAHDELARPRRPAQWRAFPLHYLPLQQRCVLPAPTMLSLWPPQTEYRTRGPHQRSAAFHAATHRTGLAHTGCGMR